MDPSGLDVLYLAPAGTVGTPGDADPDEDWDNMGRMFSAENVAPTAATANDTMARPVFTSARLEATVELIDPGKFNDAAAYEAAGTQAKVAILNAAGKYRMADNVWVEITYLPRTRPNQTQGARVKFYGTATQIRTLMSAATAPA